MVDDVTDDALRRGSWTTSFKISCVWARVRQIQSWLEISHLTIFFTLDLAKNLLKIITQKRPFIIYNKTERENKNHRTKSNTKDQNLTKMPAGRITALYLHATTNLPVFVSLQEKKLLCTRNFVWCQYKLQCSGKMNLLFLRLKFVFALFRIAVVSTCWRISRVTVFPSSTSFNTVFLFIFYPYPLQVWLCMIDHKSVIEDMTPPLSKCSSFRA